MLEERIGVSTVDRTSRMYGTVIRVPSTVPVDVWSCDYRNRYTAGCQPYVNGRHMGPILELLMLNLLCTRVVIVGTAYLINDAKDPKVFPVAVTQGK